MFESARTQLWLRRAFFVAAAFAFVMALMPQPPALPGAPGDKVQHMLAFFTLGALAASGWRTPRVWLLFAGLALFGGAIELFQAIPALHRDAELLDWLADMGAAAVAVAVTRMALAHLARRSPSPVAGDENGSPRPGHDWDA